MTFSCSRRFDLLPSAGFGGSEYSVANELGFQRVAERRPGGFAGFDSLQKIRDLVNEAVLVADLQARHPPMFHVRLIAVADVDRAPAADQAFVAVIEVLQAMQIVQVPENRGVFAVDFKCVKRLVPAGVARGFESGQRTVM